MKITEALNSIRITLQLDRSVLRELRQGIEQLTITLRKLKKRRILSGKQIVKQLNKRKL